MVHYFDNFTEEEIAKYAEYDFEEGDFGCLHSLGLDKDFHKRNGKVYAEMIESEGDFMESGGRIYTLDTTWYLPVDLDAICKDYADGEIDEYSFSPEEYELYE